MNPDLQPVRCQWLREGHRGGPRALQHLALNLYNGRAWAVDTGQICRLSEEHSDAALSLCMDAGSAGIRARLSGRCVERLRKRDRALVLGNDSEPHDGDPQF
ncbi:MAG: hypothetical protein EOM91_23110 [Sphingobacteriia bacterium]|nr:hypothetical protein [Sphingobacteriia bacterium]